MLKLEVDEQDFEQAKDQYCCGCGSEKLVSSYRRLDFRTGEEQNGWVCKPCLHRMRQEWQREQIEQGFEWGKVMLVTFGHEGYLNDELTMWDEEELNEKLSELNVQLREKSFRTRFFFTIDMNFPERPVYVVVDDGGTPEQANAVRAAEKIVLDLCSQRRIPIIRSAIGDAFRRGLLPSLEFEFEW